MVGSNLFKQIQGEMPWEYNVFGISSAVIAGVAVAGAAASAYSGYKQGKANQANIDAQNRQSQQQHAIDVAYHTQLEGYQRQLEDFANKQQDFAYQRKSYGEYTYQLAIQNRDDQVSFLQEKNYNEKLAAKVEYNAQKDVTKILQLGAEAQANTVIKDTLRANSANTRATNTQSEKMMGTMIAASQSGIAQGRSKERMLIDAFMQRNEAISQLNDKAKVGILAAVNAKDKIVNDSNIQLMESYRGLEAVMRTKPQPVGRVAPPAPVFTEKEPLAPLAPVGAAPINVATAGNSALVAGAIGTVAGGVTKAYGIL